MASSRKNPQLDLFAAVGTCLDRFLLPDRPVHFCIGLSGGLDSIALLHLAAVYCQRTTSKLSAVHVHHGLSANADAWANFVCRVADSLTIPCVVERVEVSQRAELGLEAAARAARYAVFERLSCDVLLLAQHRNDQAETLFLNLLRGSGVRGLAAMPMHRFLASGVSLVRPLLDIPRDDLLAYAQEHDLSWVEDESNTDQSLDRNYLRHGILPVLRSRFPGVDAAMVRSARHLAEADVLLQELAHQDLSLCTRGAVFDSRAGARLSEARQRNALRHWLAGFGIAPDARAFDELLRVMRDATADAEPVWRWRSREVRRYRDQWHVLPAKSHAGPALQLPWCDGLPQDIPEWGGMLSWEKTENGGIAEACARGGLQLQPRRGGERMRLRENGPTRSLKHLWQEAGTPPWLRETVPVLWIDGRVAAVPGLGVAAEFAASPGWIPHWKSAPDF